MQSNKTTLEFSVSAISTSPDLFFDSLPLLEGSSVTRIHIDAMDGNFVPRLGLSPEFVSGIRNFSQMPVDVHMMVREPTPFIKNFASAGATRIIPHFECSDHPHRLVREIKDLGLEAGLALNPLTDFRSLKYVLPDLSVITLMAINPGIIGHKFISFISDKIIELKKFLYEAAFEIPIEIDGGVTFDNISDLYTNGANLLVSGAGTVYHPSATVEENLKRLSSISDELKL